MNNAESLSQHYISREGAERDLADLIESWWSHIHISGEPGVGKTATLQAVADGLCHDYEAVEETVRRPHGRREFFRLVSELLYNQISEEKKQENTRLSNLSVSVCGTGGGVGWDSSDPEAPEVSGLREELETLCDVYHDDERLLICLDDVHNIDPERPKFVEELIHEVAKLLPKNVALVTAGRISVDKPSASVKLTEFTREETATFLREHFSSVPDERVTAIHERWDGHPLLVGQFAEIHRVKETPPRPRSRLSGPAHQELREKYLESLSEDEERLLRRTAPLFELHPRLCSEVLSSMDRTTVDRALRSLADRVIVHTTGEAGRGERAYEIHDTFREFLLEGLPSGRRADVRQTARAYYCRELLSPNTDIEVEAVRMRSFLNYLPDATNVGSGSVERLIEEGIGGEQLSFYAAQSLLERVREWDGEDLPWSFVRTVFDAVEQRDSLGDVVFDEKLGEEWGEQLLRHDWFTDPEDIQVEYLRGVVDANPEIVRRAIQQAETDEFEIQRALFQAASALPAEHVADLSSKVVDWLEVAGGDLEWVGMEVFDQLCEGGKYDAAVDVLGAVAAPKDWGSEESSHGQGQFVATRFVDSVEENLPRLVANCGESLVDTFESVIREISEEYRDRERRGRPWRSIPTGVSWVDTQGTSNTATVSRIEFEARHGRVYTVYNGLFKVATDWVEQDPSAETRQELIEKYLDDEERSLRRAGFYLASQFPESNLDRVERELRDETNYGDAAVRAEHHRLLERGFGLLHSTAKHRVCETIRAGPYDSDGTTMDSIGTAGEETDQSSEAYEREKVRRWQRDRLYYVREELPEKHRDYLEELLDEHGEPESRPGVWAETKGGKVDQLPPDDATDIPRDDAEQFYRFCVDWEPPEDDVVVTTESDDLQEVSTQGLCEVLENRVEEHPASYATAAETLGQAEPVHVRRFFRALKDVVDEAESVQWGPVLDLSERVTDLEQWNVSVVGAAASLLETAISSGQAALPEIAPERTRQVVLELGRAPDTRASAVRDGNSIGNGTHQFSTFRLVMSYLFHQCNNPDEFELGREFRELLRDRLCSPSVWYEQILVGEYLYWLWLVDEELIDETLEDIFPTDGTPEADTQLFAALEGYIRRPAQTALYDRLRPYFVRGMQRLDESGETDSRQSDAETMAVLACRAYVHHDEGPSDEVGLLRQYYDSVELEDYGKVSQILKDWVENRTAPEDCWQKVEELWRWRLSEQSPERWEEADTTFCEFVEFFECLSEIEDKNVRELEGLLEQTAPYIAQERRGISRLEPWLAEQSEEYPTEAIEVYRALVEGRSKDQPYRYTTEENHRERLYTNAVECGGRARELALDIANTFAADGKVFDQDFLSNEL